MKTNIDRVFFYHGHGAALGGTVTRPFNAVIDTQGAAAIPIGGGHGKAHVEGYRFPHKQSGLPDIVSFDSADTEVTGNEQNGAYKTVVTTTITGLNVYNVLTAEKVVAKLTSTRNLQDDETRVDPTGSEIKGLKIGGRPCKVDLDTQLFRDHDTHRGFREHYNQNSQFRQMARKRFCWDESDNNVPQVVRERYKWRKQPEALTDGNKLLPCSLVKQVQCDFPGVIGCANVLIVPEFGAVYLAELLVAEHRRRLTMLRLQLGSPLDATLDVSGGESNGVNYP